MTDVIGPADAGAVNTLTTTTDVSNPAAGDTWFQDCVANNPATGTNLPSRFMNRFLQQVRRVIRLSGAPENNSYDDMLGYGIQQGLQWVGTFGGTAYALTATMTPASPSLMAGMEVKGLVSVSNAGMPTLNVNGVGPLPITRVDGSSLSGGEMAPGGVASFIYTGSGFVLMTPQVLLLPSSTFYVDSGAGNDAWDGTSSTFISGSTGPKASDQAMINTVAANYITDGVITINSVGPQSGFNIPTSLIGAWNINSVGTSLISATTSGVNGGIGISVSAGVVATINGFSFSCLNGNVLVARSAAAVVSACHLTGCTGQYSIVCSSGNVNIIGSCTWTGTGPGILTCNSPGKLSLGSAGGSSGTITIINPATFTGACATATDGGLIFIQPGSSVPGSAVGKKFISDAGIINADGAGINAFPGNVAGTTANNGVYKP